MRKLRKMSGKKLMNPKKIYLAAGGAAGGSCWWEPLVGAAAGEKRKWSRRWWSRREENTFWIVDFGKKLGLQSKKTSLTKMAC